MSQKSIQISSTATSTTTQDWRPVEPLAPAKNRGTAGFQVEPSAMIVSDRRQASDAPNIKITVSIEPASVSRRQAIRRLNEEIEGRSWPADTYASKTAG
jgi:hypothetical protein